MILVQFLVKVSLKQCTQTGLLIIFGHRKILHLWNQPAWGKDKLAEKLMHWSLHHTWMENIDSVLTISSFQWLQITAADLTEEK